MPDSSASTRLRLSEPHVCRPPYPWKWLFFWRFEIGELWDCDCGQQYVFDPPHIRSGRYMHVAGARHWPWISTWPDRYSIEHGRTIKRQVSWPPGYRPTVEDLAGKVVTGWER